MVDYNFFEGYRVKRPKRSFGVRLFNVIFLMALMALAAYIAFNYYRLDEQQREIADLDSEIAAIMATDDIARITSKQALLDELTIIINNMEAAGDDIKQSSNIDEDLLVTIADSLPSDVRISSLYISENSISIAGEGLSKAAIAEFEYNLRQISAFYGVFVDSIRRNDEDEFLFDMTMTVGGDLNEH